MASRFQHSSSFSWWRLGVALILAGQSMMVSLGLNMTDEPLLPTSGWYWPLHGLLIASAGATLWLLGGALFSHFFAALRQHRLTVEALFVASLLGALVVSLQSTLLGQGPLYYEVVSLVVVIYSFGHSLRAYAQREADAILAQARARHATALVGQPGALHPVDVTSLRVDDLVWVPPGGLVTVDGVITQGQAYVLLSHLTGEPTAVPLGPGQPISAGALSVDGLLQVRVTSTARSIDALMAHLSSAVPSAYQELADRVTVWFLPIVGSVAGLTFAFWSFLASPAVALQHAMSVLLVACPCALGMATPLAVRSFLFTLGRHGWRGRSGQLVERLALVDTIFFDKTGTLTLSQLQLGPLQLSVGCPVPAQLLQGMVALVQSQVPHPISQAFTAWPVLPSAQLMQLRVYPGQGVWAQLQFSGQLHTLVVGQLSFVQPHLSNSAWPSATPRSVYIGLDASPAGVVTLAETPAPHMTLLLQELQSHGLQLQVLTGDPHPQLTFPSGVTLHKGLSASDKAQLVQSAQAQGRRVLFVGDGLNDTLALSQAFCSVAVQSGSALSHAAAFAVVTQQGLLQLPTALTLAQRARAALRWNLGFSALYNFLGVALAASGLLHPVLAAVLMLSSSVFVAWRALLAVNQKASDN